MAKKGDRVRYLNAVGGGTIVRIEGNMAWVEDDEGFENPVLLRECVVVSSDVPKDTENKDLAKSESSKATVSKTIQPSAEEKTVEIPGGDKLNITLGFEPVERVRLSETDFDATLINDSNYFLSFSFATKAADEHSWICRCNGVVEPNTELWLGTYGRKDVACFDSICLQYIAYKKQREFELKPPGAVALKVDTTKFFKLHCFRSNPYFENDVLAFDIVKNDSPCDRPSTDLSALRKWSAESATTTNKKSSLSSSKNKTTNNKKSSLEPLVVDLHINSLVDTTAGMSNADILNLQIDTFRGIMNENMRNFGRKIIFIHGKGEGVLRQALTKELNHRYKGHDVQDASFQEYGYGATQVTIRQHPKN